MCGGCGLVLRCGVGCREGIEREYTQKVYKDVQRQNPEAI